MKEPLKQAIIDGNADSALALTQALLASGACAREILDEALLPGMEVVGARMRDGDCFIPEVLLSARVMQAASTCCARTWPPARRPAAAWS